MKMASVGDVKEKVQRIITGRFGSVRLDDRGRMVMTYKSSVVFVEVASFGKESIRISFVSPLVTNLKITNELCRWLVTEGQSKWFGNCRLNDADGEDNGWVYFEHSILGDDVDESEVLNALAMMHLGSDQLDNEIQSRFGGELFGNDEE
jgi:hypothetical protein